MHSSLAFLFHLQYLNTALPFIKKRCSCDYVFSCNKLHVQNSFFWGHRELDLPRAAFMEELSLSRSMIEARLQHWIIWSESVASFSSQFYFQRKQSLQPSSKHTKFPCTTFLHREMSKNITKLKELGHPLRNLSGDALTFCNMQVFSRHPRLQHLWRPLTQCLVT